MLRLQDLPIGSYAKRDDNAHWASKNLEVHRVAEDIYEYFEYGKRKSRVKPDSTIWGCMDFVITDLHRPEPKPKVYSVIVLTSMDEIKKFTNAKEAIEYIKLNPGKYSMYEAIARFL